MARIRKFVAYRRLERPFTRKSKYRAKSFVRSSPNSRITRFVMGDKTSDFPISVCMRAKSDCQIRDNAIEAARQVVGRRLERTIGKNSGYRFIIRVFPHHFLRENPLAAGAGADRMSTGMKMSYGKVIGIAARVFENQPIIEIQTTKANLDKVKAAIDLARVKMPVGCRITVEDIQ